MKDFIGYIYLTTNIINNKIYIGQHINEEWHYDVKYIGSGLLLNRAINKYGKENFYNQLICYVDNQESLNKLEIFFIDYYDSTNPEIGYNISKGGNSGSDVINWIKENESERYKDICNKISNTMIENGTSKGTNNAMHHSRYKRTKELNNKISKTMIENGTTKGTNNPMYGIVRPNEWIEEHSKIMKYNASLPDYKNPMQDKHHSEKTKLIQRQKKLGKHPKYTDYSKEIKILHYQLTCAKKKNNLELIIQLENEIQILKDEYDK